MFFSVSSVSSVVNAVYSRSTTTNRTSADAQLLQARDVAARRFVGPDDARGVRIEGQHDGRAAAIGGAAPDALDDLGMAAMQAIEVAERQHRLVPARGACIIREPGDLHVRG